MKLKLMIIGLFVFGFTFTSQAQFKKQAPPVVKKSIKQQKKIQHGVKSGELTKKETVKLQRQQRRIFKAKRKAKADGVVTPKEKAKLHVRHKRANAAIYRMKHNKARQ